MRVVLYLAFISHSPPSVAFAYFCTVVWNEYIGFNYSTYHHLHWTFLFLLAGAWQLWKCDSVVTIIPDHFTGGVKSLEC